MIDIHTHILPGLDDGAADWGDALTMARAAVEDGIETLIATPHHANGTYMNEASLVEEAVEQMNERLRLERIPLTVRSGQEIRIHDEFLDALNRRELLTLAGSHYLLLELPFSRIPSRTPDLLHELRILGITPIIAHPERNAEMASHPDRLTALIDAGAYAQVTTGSLLGGFGKRIEQYAWTMCRQGLIHIVSSDAHHVEKRGFQLKEAYARVSQELGEEFENYLRQNARAVLHDEPIDPKSPVTESKSWLKKFSSIFTRKE